MNVLAIGDKTAVDLAADLYPEAEIFHAKLGPGKKETGYNAVLSFMTLPTVPIKNIKEVLQSYVDALQGHGEIVIFVPALEWAAMQILSPKPDPAYIYHLFGSQQDSGGYYKCGFTMMELRALCTHAGIAVTHASTGEYKIGESLCECHTIRGIRK